MDIRATYQQKTRPLKSTSARWRPIGDETAQVLVRPIRNTDTQREMSRVLRRFRRRDISVARQNAIHARVVVDTLLEDWKDLTDGDDPIEFSRETALKLMIEYPELMADIIDVAEDLADELEAEEADAAKN